MPKLGNRVPKYRWHKNSGLALVSLDGLDFYLGPWQSPESKAEYDRLVGLWQANGRRLPLELAAGLRAQSNPDRTVTEVLAAFWEHAQQHYRKNGEPTSELDLIRLALKPVRKLYGHTSAKNFGPLALKVCRHEFLNAKMSRGVINHHVGRIRRAFKWAVENELVPPGVHHGLSAVRGLQRGRSTARETEPVRPVPDAHVDAVLPLVSPPVRAMIELQRLTGMRSGEVVLMRGCDLDTTGPIWVYTPDSHKTEHHGIERNIAIGPRAQEIVKPFLKPDVTAYLFSPRDAVAARNVRARQNRKSRMTPSQAARRPKPNPRRAPRDRYDDDSYRYAISRACTRAGVPHWHPHRLRHTCATRIRKEHGIEAARVVLGHRSAAVTEVYAEIDQSKAVDVMADLG